MDLHLNSKSVVVTGASKGIGKAIAMEFAREGAHVFISSRNEDSLQKTVKEIKEETNNTKVNYVVCDMKNADEIKQLIEKVVETNGTVDVLVNNAGGPPAGSFLEMTDDEWYHAFEQNLLSVVRATREVIPFMKKQQSGKIINITSSSIKQTIDNLILSNTMRPGVLGLAKALSQELAPHNILINTVGPGLIETDRTMELNTAWSKESGIPVEQLKAQAVEKIPMKRYGQPSEFAKTVLFLGSGANTYVTGQALIIDGGFVKAL